MLYQKHFNVQQHKIFGINSKTYNVTHNLPVITWQQEESIYDFNNRLTSHNHYHYSDNIKYTQIVDKNHIRGRIARFTYDHSNRLVKESSYNFYEHYKSSSFPVDTVYVRRTNNHQTHEYIYSADSQLEQHFISRDSTIEDTRSTSNPLIQNTKTTCDHCHPNYLSSTKYYSKDHKLLSYIMFTQNQQPYSKQHYFYDSQERLVRETDSTSWYSSTSRLYLKSIITYQYTNQGKIMTEVQYKANGSADPESTETSYFNTDGKLVKKHHSFNGTDYCNEYVFAYINSELIKEKCISNSTHHRITYYFYNRNGLLSQERATRNGKLEEIIRYHYTHY